MKNNIFLNVLRAFLMVAILSALSSTEVRGADSVIAQNAFDKVMANPWYSDSNIALNVLIFWTSWDDQEKQAILRRMGDQGLLSQWQVANWPLARAPQPIMGG